MLRTKCSNPRGNPLLAFVFALAVSVVIIGRSGWPVAAQLSIGSLGRSHFAWLSLSLFALFIGSRAERLLTLALVTALGGIGLVDLVLIPRFGQPKGLGMKLLCLALLTAWLWVPLGVVPCTERLLRRVRRNRRTRFSRGRARLHDTEYLEIMQPYSAGEGALMILLRRTVADVCGVEPEFLYPSDRLRVLRKMIEWALPFPWHWDLFRGPCEFSGAFGAQFFDEFGLPLWKLRLDDEYAMHLPPFDGSSAPNWSGETKPRTLGEWVREATQIVLQFTPVGWDRVLASAGRTTTRR